MKIIRKIFPIGHFIISVLFIGCALALISLAGFELWQGIQPIAPSLYVNISMRSWKVLPC
jgi:hypothetical protein